MLDFKFQILLYFMGLDKKDEENYEKGHIIHLISNFYVSRCKQPTYFIQNIVLLPIIEVILYIFFL